MAKIRHTADCLQYSLDLSIQSKTYAQKKQSADFWTVTSFALHGYANDCGPFISQPFLFVTI